MKMIVDIKKHDIGYMNNYDANKDSSHLDENNLYRIK